MQKLEKNKLWLYGVKHSSSFNQLQKPTEDECNTHVDVHQNPIHDVESKPKHFRPKRVERVPDYPKVLNLGPLVSEPSH